MPRDLDDLAMTFVLLCIEMHEWKIDQSVSKYNNLISTTRGFHDEMWSRVGDHTNMFIQKAYETLKIMGACPEDFNLGLK